MERRTILLLSGGSVVGQNVMASLDGRRDDLRLIATSSIAAEPSIFHFDAAYLTPPTQRGSEAFADRIQDIIKKEDPDLLIPCRDEDILFLAQLREQAAPSDRRRFLCGDRALAECLLDKHKSWQISEEFGLPFAATILARTEIKELEAFAEVYGYPLVFTPVEGYASRGVRFILDVESLRRAASGEGGLIQQYLGNGELVKNFFDTIASEGVPLFYSLENVKYSLQALISQCGEVTSTYVSANTMRYGKSEEIRPLSDDSLFDLVRKCGQVFAQHGWRGPINIQCEQSPTGQTMIYEFNGRFTGATHARYLLGYDEVGLVIDDSLSMKLPENKVRGDRVVRAPRGSVIPTALVRQLGEKGCWVATK